MSGAGSCQGPRAGALCATKPCCDFFAVCTAPCVPPQGAIMPVLYNPGTFTVLHPTAVGESVTYTLNVITTVPIAVGTVFRFQFFSGLNTTYAEAFGAGAISQVDVLVNKQIPVATVVVVAFTHNSTTLVAFSGSAVYGTTNQAVREDGDGATTGFVTNATCLAWAFVPTATNAYPNTTWVPVAGQPQFTIGFAKQVPAVAGICSIPSPVVFTPAELTAPNVPDQWLAGSGPLVQAWTWLYNVVFPEKYAVETTDTAGGLVAVCTRVEGIKVEDAVVVHVPGSWTALRDILSQPWTVLQVNTRTPSRWAPYNYLGNNAESFVTVPPSVGPFQLAAEPGQLAVVYFRPRQQVTTVCNPELPTTTLLPSFSGPWIAAAQLGLLVTSPLPARTTLYFTVDPYNEALSGFDPSNPMVEAFTVCAGGTAFVTNAPGFQWVTGSCVIPAGTVVFIDHIGSATQDPVVVDAHDTGANRVGAIVANTLATATTEGGSAVPSIAVLSDWVSGGVGSPRPLAASRFVTAVLSDQYTGDFMPLAPTLTMPTTRASGAVGYGLNRVIAAGGLPGPVQAALVNGGAWTHIPDGTEVGPANMPVFTGLGGWAW